MLSADVELIADMMRSPEWRSRCEQHNRERVAQGLELHTFTQFINDLDELFLAKFASFNAKRAALGFPPVGRREFRLLVEEACRPLLIALNADPPQSGRTN